MKKVSVAILVTEIFERLTYYSFVANIVLYITSKLCIAQTTATTINMTFIGFVYFIPIFGGFLSDAYFGRFNTILGSMFLYLIGALLIPLSTVDFDHIIGEVNSNENKDVNQTNGTLVLGAIINKCEPVMGSSHIFFFIGLAFVALGAGGYKANMGPFGAEQVEDLGRDAVQTFFNWFYWGINFGAFNAFIGVAYIQQEVNFGLGFLVPLFSLVVAMLLFAGFRGSYTMSEPKGSMLATSWHISTAGCCKSAPAANPNLPDGSEKKMLARAKKSFGGKHKDHEVDGLRSVIKVMPFALLVIMYWAIYAQMSNTYFTQSEHMDVRFAGTKIPVAALNVFNTLSVILLIPPIERGFYPFMKRIGYPLSHLKKMGIGMVFAVLSVVVAGIVEIYRKEAIKADGVVIQELAGESINASSLSVLVQIPQFSLFGISEIFTSITAIEFIYDQVPVYMQCLVFCLYLATVGAGMWASTAILEIVEAATVDDPWWGDDINHTKMENLMFLLAGMMAANFGVFLLVAHVYQYQDRAAFEDSSADPGVKNIDVETVEGDAYQKETEEGDAYQEENEEGGPSQTSRDDQDDCKNCPA